jgi:hypothetical protein
MFLLVTTTIRETTEIGKLTGRLWALGLAYGAAFWCLMLTKSTFGWLVDYDSPYPFRAFAMQHGGMTAWLECVCNV